MKEVNKKYLIIGIVTTLILCLGVSVAYFTGIIRGEGKEITITAKKLEVIFTDTEAITASNIEPGWETTKTFSVENKTGKEYFYNINLEELVNTFEGRYLEYKITSSSGYNMSEYREVPIIQNSKEIIGNRIRIENEEVHTYRIEFRFRSENENQSIDQGKEFSGKLSITETEDKSELVKKILEDNPVVLERTDFSTTLGSETPTNDTIYRTYGTQTEDGSEVYYFAGNVANNWVKFGQDENDNDLYWRIIRTNEDGGIRLLYAGTSPDTTEGYITVDGVSKFKYNGLSNNAMYVGYMYGTTGSLENNRLNTNDSIVKTAIDTWYSRGINTKTDTSENTYDSYISKTAIYCNDRSLDELSAGAINYAANRRLSKPSYRCGYNSSNSIPGMYSDASIADKFTASKKTGNGDLTYPVALITADEMKMAGAKTGAINEYTYYHLNSAGVKTLSGAWWTMSPSRKLVAPAPIIGTYVFHVNTSNGKLISAPSTVPPLSPIGRVYTATYAIRPVVSLKSCVTFRSGNGVISGDINTPYEVSVDNACASLEN